MGRIRKVTACFYDGSCEPFNPGGKMGMGSIIMMGVNVSQVNQVVKGDMDAYGLTYTKILTNSYFINACQSNSNNVAEYLALIWVLEMLITLKIKGAYIFGDSMLVTEQMNGKWKMKGGRYIFYAKTAKELDRQHKYFWLPREYNQMADELSTEDKYYLENDF